MRERERILEDAEQPNLLGFVWRLVRGVRALRMGAATPPPPPLGQGTVAPHGEVTIAIRRADASPEPAAAAPTATTSPSPRR